MGKDTLSGRKKYTNGKISKFFVPGTEPDGWLLGTAPYEKEKHSLHTKMMWKNPDFVEKQKRARSTVEYKKRLADINKGSWEKNRDKRIEALKKSASNGWSEERKNEASIRMKIKWEDTSYRESQTKSLKECHKTMYDKHPEYKKRLSESAKSAWHLNKEAILKKQFVTKTNNSSWNTSIKEENYYHELVNKYGVDNVIRQYRDEDRYPFYCDFYIPSEDLFIEIQGTWTHGGHLFDPSNPKDIETLGVWKEKSKTSTYYKKAIEVWTVFDPMKKKVSEENNLNIQFIY